MIIIYVKHDGVVAGTILLPWDNFISLALNFEKSILYYARFSNEQECTLSTGTDIRH